jgi:glycosyltransferase involved in cell wall biosynthesis
MNDPAAPIRLAFAITELDRGGAELTFARLVTGLDRGRWEPRVFCLSGRGELAESIENAGVPVVFLDARGKWDWGLIPRLARELRAFRPRLLQTFLHHANLAGRFAARRAAVERVVCGIRVAEPRSQWRLRLDRWTQNKVDAYVCVSPSVAQFSQAQGRLPANKLHVIRNGVDAERLASARPLEWTDLGLPADAQVVLVAGRLDEQKRPRLAFAACRPLFAVFPRLHLVFAGIGPLTETIRLASRESGVSDRVHLLGTREDLPALMKSAALLLHPSAWEGSPNVLLEARAAGLPIIASDIPGNRDALDDGPGGILVSENAPEPYSFAIRSLLESPEEVRARAVESQIRCRSERSWEQMIANYEALYDSLLGRGTSGKDA